VIGSLDLGGTEQQLVRVLSKLASNPMTSNTYQVLTLNKKGMLAPELEKIGVAVTPLLKSHEIRFFSKLPNFLRKGLAASLILTRLMMVFFRSKSQHALLHFYLPESYILGMLASFCVGFNQTKIMSRRSLNYYQQKIPGLAYLEKHLHKRTHCIMGNSLAILNQLTLEENVPQDKLKLVYNGLDISPYLNLPSREALRKELQLEESEVVLIMVANLIYYKGHADLFKALSIVDKNSQTTWRLLIVGRDDGIGATLKETAAALNIADNLLWLGSRQDIPRLLKMADIGILCSHEEGFSNAILEAMASRLPLVVTDVGGNKEAVINGKTGWVVPAKDCQALANAISDLISDKDKAKKFGEAGFLRVKTEFSLEACVNAHQAIYDERILCAD
jgi:glycosyltransferase involved in cell wall biosynthesis